MILVKQNSFGGSRSELMSRHASIRKLNLNESAGRLDATESGVQMDSTKEESDDLDQGGKPALHENFKQRSLRNIYWTTGIMHASKGVALVVFIAAVAYLGTRTYSSQYDETIDMDFDNFPSGARRTKDVAYTPTKCWVEKCHNKLNGIPKPLNENQGDVFAQCWEKTYNKINKFDATQREVHGVEFDVLSQMAEPVEGIRNLLGIPSFGRKLQFDTGGDCTVPGMCNRCTDPCLLCSCSSLNSNCRRLKKENKLKKEKKKKEKEKKKKDFEEELRECVQEHPVEGLFFQALNKVQIDCKLMEDNTPCPELDKVHDEATHFETKLL